MTISVLIPCYNEELSLRKALESWLNQTRKLDRIIVVDDKSTDKSVEIIKSFGRQVTLVELPKKGGNKSIVQEIGLKHVDTDIFIATDADTFASPNFVAEVEKAFQDPNTTAFAGHVRSLPKNWLTACRELEYCLGQLIHKTAQSGIGFIYVIPGCASAFKTVFFKKHITFDHDTLTEDLDFTYKLNSMGQKVTYSSKAIVYTQDPASLKVYINQMRRWFSGGWQNLLKHKKIIFKPLPALELSLIFIDMPFYIFTLLILPFINFSLFIVFMSLFMTSLLITAIITSIIDRRLDILLYSPTYLITTYVNCFIYIEQFFKEIILKKKQLTWYHPERWQISH